MNKTKKHTFFLAFLVGALIMILFGNNFSVEAKTKTKSLPKIITKNHYGFLSADQNDTKLIKNYGASWVRPHPGPFLWDSAQVLIAGAAGGNDDFLNFYRSVLSYHPEVLDSFDIGNVHCISNDNYSSFNVEPYKNMLAEFGLGEKPIWVTEAEAILSSDAATNATQTYNSTKQALSLGAQKIFFTRYGFPDTDKKTKKRYKAITRL